RLYQAIWIFFNGYVKTERNFKGFFFFNGAGEGASCYLVSHSTKASLLYLMLVAKQPLHRA
ncbi:hypothetical protein K5549_020548, partial [Capra hircus]|uniref:Uncharacterized protein n=1 Tax=Capra hircus TaxID=9925 RepID=A0A452EVV0_CAPHI